MTTLYALRLLSGTSVSEMAKFDEDFNVAAVYHLEPKGFSYTCDCPANLRSVVTKPCKHKRIMPVMLGAVNTDRFYEPESRSWCQPLAPDLVGEAEPRVVGSVTGRTESNGSHIEEVPKVVIDEATHGQDFQTAVALATEPPKLRRRV